MGGYQSSSPWKNVNRMNHATDIAANLGDLLAYAGVYTSGTCSLTRGYLWSADGSWPGSSAQTVAFNMNTETTAGINSSWNMHVGRNDCGTAFKESQYAYISGGGDASVDLFTMSTETMSTGATSTGDTGDSSYQYGMSSFSDETKGYMWGLSGHVITFSTGTSYSVGTATGVAVNGQQKGISSKLGRGYFGNEGNYNGGNNLRRYVTSSDTYTTVAKPVTNSGEENFDMGQSWQYMMGCYDGAQNNRGWKFTYSTDSGYELGSGSLRTGVPGGSSGHSVWK
jgi:hypothetical protein